MSQMTELGEMDLFQCVKDESSVTLIEKARQRGFASVELFVKSLIAALCKDGSVCLHSPISGLSGME
jgi:hypothetical protein